MRERELVENPGGPIVQRDVLLVFLGGAVIPEQGIVDVADQFQGPWREWIQFGRAAEIAYRRLGNRIEFHGLVCAVCGRVEQLPSPVRLTALQEPQHGVAIELYGATEVLDG